jgi:hypothetical protein
MRVPGCMRIYDVKGIALTGISASRHTLDARRDCDHPDTKIGQPVLDVCRKNRPGFQRRPTAYPKLSDASRHLG